MHDLTKLIKDLDDKTNLFINESAEKPKDLSVEDFDVLQKFRKANNYNVFLESMENK
jgi:hypothetical protein